MLVSTYIKKGKNFEFELIDDFCGSIGPNYIYGAIVIQYNDSELLGVWQFDLVDQLWCYFASAVSEIQSGKSVQGYFPDQSLLYSFKRVKPDMIRVQFDDKVTVLPEKDFIEGLIEGGIFALSRFIELNPKKKDGYSMYLNKLKEARSPGAGVRQ